MAEIHDSVSPKGIITFEMIYRAIDKTMKRVDALETRVLKLESIPQPIKKVEAVGKHIEKKETTKK